LRALAITLSSTVIVVGSAAWVWSPWVVLPAIVLVATRQHALFVLAHEAAHHRLFARRGLNEFAGRAIGGVTGISMCAYRVVHRLHHNDLYGPSDPDMALHGGYPRGRAYLLRKLAADLAGLTAWKTWRYFFGLPGVTRPGSGGGPLRPLDDTAPALRRAALHDRWAVVACQMLIPLGLVLAGGLDALLRYAALWLLPMATVLQVLIRHCWRRARTLPAPWEGCSCSRTTCITISSTTSSRPSRNITCQRCTPCSPARDCSRAPRCDASVRPGGVSTRRAPWGRRKPEPVAHYNQGLRGAAAVALRIQTFLGGRQ
jgi:hypothetical protein